MLLFYLLGHGNVHTGHHFSCECIQLEIRFQPIVNLGCFRKDFIPLIIEISKKDFNPLWNWVASETISTYCKKKAIVNLVFCFQNYSNLLWEKTVLVIEFAKFLRWIEQFIRILKGQYNFWNRMLNFITYSWRFLRSITL